MAPSRCRLALAAVSCLAFMGPVGSSSVSILRPGVVARPAFLAASSSRVSRPFTAHSKGLQSRVNSMGRVPVRRRSQRIEPRCAVDVGMALYDVQIWAKTVVDSQLTHLTPVSGAILYASGLLTSLSPCALSLVPLTIAYLTDDGAEAEGNEGTIVFRAAMFTIGLALSLSALGLSATLAGKLFGTAGGGAVLGSLLPLSAAAIAIVMGLNLLDLIRFSLPSFETSATFDGIPRPLQAMLLGASSALIASPCSTPVLASILGFVATSEEPYLGAGLLFAYSLGYSTPLLVAGVLSGAFTSFLASKGDGFAWVTPFTGALLISYGTYAGLNSLFPIIS